MIGKEDRIYTGVCRCDKQCLARGDLFCSYCGQPASVPWWISESEALDGFNCLTAAFDEQGCSIRLMIPGSDTSRQARNLIKYLNLPEAKLEEYIQAQFGESIAVNTWNAVTRTMTLTWPRDTAPQDKRLNHISLYLKLERKLDGEKDLPPRDILIHYPVQPNNAVQLSSRDSRFAENGPDGAELAHIVEPELKKEPMRLALGSDQFNAGDVATISVCRPDGVGRRLLLEPTISHGRAELTIGERDWEALFPKANAGGNALLVVTPLNAGNSALGSARLSVAFVMLELKVLEKRLNFRFQKNVSNWVSTGVSDDVAILSLKGDWGKRFKIGVRPAGGLEQVLALTGTVKDNLLQIRAKLKPAFARDGGKVPLRQSSFRIVLVAQRINQNDQALVQGPAFKEMKLDLSADQREPAEILAIDFGTTNSAAAAILRGAVTVPRTETSGSPALRIPVQAIALDSGAHIDSQTTLYYSAPEDDPDGVDLERSYIGGDANFRLELGMSAGRYFSGLKTMLIESIKDRNNPYKPISEKESRRVTEICRDFLYLFLKQVFESQTLDGRAVKKVVFTFPVECSHEYRDTLTGIFKAALEKLGHPVSGPDAVKIHSSFDEATAGGLWWFYEKYFSQLKPKGYKLVLVYDYGGGTTDLSLLRFDKLEGGDVVEARVLGVAGGQFCGGDDVTWRMAREFVRASGQKDWVNLSTPLGAKLHTAASYRGQPRGIWKQEVPVLILTLDKSKVSLMGGKPPNDPKLKEMFTAEDRSQDFAAQWIEETSALTAGEQKPREIFFQHKQAENGRYYAMPFNRNNCTYDSNAIYGPNDPGQKSTRESILGLLGYDLLSPGEAGESIMHEALAALEIAKQLMRRVLPGEKVDHLLVIGQASQSPIFKTKIREALKGLSKSEPEILERLERPAGSIDPKTCVANGACFSAWKDQWFVTVPTLLKDILYETGVNEFEVVLKSSDDRNQAKPIPAPLAKRFRDAQPDASKLSIDMELNFTPAAHDTFNLIAGTDADWSGATGGFKAMVIDRRSSTHMQAAQAAPAVYERIAELAEADDTLNQHQFLALWPDEQPSEALIFEFRL